MQDTDLIFLLWFMLVCMTTAFTSLLKKLFFINHNGKQKLYSLLSIFVYLQVTVEFGLRFSAAIMIEFYNIALVDIKHYNIFLVYC